MTLISQPLPPGPITERDGALARDWHVFLTDRMDRLTATPRRLSVVSVVGRESSISATTLYVQALNAGLYRVSYSARITQDASSSSSLRVTIKWTDRAQAMSQSGAAITGNTVTTQQNDSLLFRIDAGTSVTYETAYGSVGAKVMQYALDVVFEAVAA